MVGRPRRRHSTSSVESLDLGGLNYHTESDLIKRLLPEVAANPDDWPCFVLRDATVYYRAADGSPEEHWMANLLYVNYDGAFVVRGRLDSADDADKLTHPNAEGAYMTLRNVVTFSMMPDDDVPGSACVWAGGESGWYEIKPSKVYEPIYQKMNEAVTLYYTVHDIYRGLSSNIKRDKAKLQTPLEEILFKYAASACPGLVLEEAKQRCIEHAPFLLSHCAKKTEQSEVPWPKTRFFQFLQDECRHVATTLAERLELSAQGKDPGPTTKRPPAPKKQAPLLPPAPQQPKVLPHRPVPAESPGVSTPDECQLSFVDGDLTDITEVNQAAVVRLLEVFDSIFADNNIVQKLSPKHLHSRMYVKCSISDYNLPPNVTSYYAPDIVKVIDKKWYPTPFFEYLKQCARQPRPELAVSHGEILHRLRFRRTSKPTTIATNPTSQSSVASADDAVGGTDGGSHDIYSTPTVARRGRKPKVEEQPKTAGKTPRLRLTSHKRPFSADEEDTNASSRDKAPRLSVSDDEMLSDDEDIPAHLDASDGVPVVIRAQKLPSMTPKGPNGTWVCEEEGCGFIVHSGGQEEGHDLISDHFRYHETRHHQDVLDYVRSEGQSHGMQLNHLLDRIKKMGEDNERTRYIGNVPVPKPIKRRVLI